MVSESRREGLPKEWVDDDMAAGFRALGDIKRLKMVYLLSHLGGLKGATVGQLQDHLHIPTQSVVSHHLRELVLAGLVKRVSQGKENHYEVVEEALAWNASVLLELIVKEGIENDSYD